MAETELERAEKKFAQAKARLQGLRNREATGCARWTRGAR